MKIYRKSLQFLSQFMGSYTVPKPLSTSSPSLSILDPLISRKPDSNSSEIPISNHPKSIDSIPNLQSNRNSHLNDLIPPVPISETHENPNLNDPNSSKTHENPILLSQSFFTDALLSMKKQPLCALEFFKWAEKQPGFSGPVEFSFILFYILMDSGKKMTKGSCRISVQNVFAGLQCYDATFLRTCLIDTSVRFGFRLDSKVFDCFLNNLVHANRTQDAVDCLNWILENPAFDVEELCPFVLLVRLCSRKQNETVENLFDKMHLKGVKLGSKPSKPFSLVIRVCMEQGKVEEAEKWFARTMKRGISLGLKAYYFAIDSGCKKPNSSGAACQALKKMREKGLVPGSWAFECTIMACLKEGKMKEALMVRDEMLACGKRMTLAVVTQFVRGYCLLGDIDSALKLSTSIPEHGLSPDEVIISVLIEGCFREGKMEKAGELYDLMIEKGMQPTIYATVLMIKGFLNARRLEKAQEQLMKTGAISSEKNVGGNGFRFDTITLLTILMEELYMKGEVDEAFQVFDEMKNGSIVRTDFTYNTVIRWLCQLGQTSRARDMLHEFIKEENFRPSCNTYRHIIKKIIEEADIDSALSVYTEMSENGVSPDIHICAMLIIGLCKSNNLDRALDLRKEMANKGLKLNAHAYTALIDGLRMRKDMKNAYVIFSELLDAGLTPNRTLYYEMISSYQHLPRQKYTRRKPDDK